MSEVDDLISVPEAARRAEVSRNTMLLAAKHGTIKAKQIGRGWFVYGSDVERWKRENYRPEMAYRYPVKKQDGEDKPA